MELKKICVNCESYCVEHFGSELEGTCRVLPGDRPGQRGKKVRFDTDASQCPKFEQLAYVHTDTSQIQDQHTRTLGGYEEVKSDRLIYEKHERDIKPDHMTTAQKRRKAKGRITINEGLCLGCGYCVHFCSRGCIGITGEKVSPQGHLLASVVEPDNCTACGICGWMCPHLAIDVYKYVEVSKV